MTLEDYRADMMRCTRCSYCKWIPFDNIKSHRFAKGCPSIEFNRFQPYSAGGRLAAAYSLLEGRSECTERFVDITFNCLLCGLCDVACKVCRYNMEPLEAMRELRFKMVEDGKLLPGHMQYINNLRKEDDLMLKSRRDRGQWAEGLDIQPVGIGLSEVVFHAGCRFSYDKELWPKARTAVTLLKNAGINIAIMGGDECCCGGRAYNMGFREDFNRCANKNIAAWKKAGVKTVVTSCADCYHTFKRLYPKVGSEVQVFHTVEYLDRLVREGKIKFSSKLDLKVTYHDPCHLGRQGEPYVPWQGKEKKIKGQMVVYEPRKPRYNGAFGVYDTPRNLIKSIPGVELVEMERIRESAWCCGAGGGVKEAYPEFSSWTANERIAEAKATGAEAIVSACPGCERNFLDAVSSSGDKLKVFDIVDLVQKAI